jgi:F0F1-type ATP synthase assembly protein I
VKNKKEISETYKTYIKTSAVGLEVGLSVVVGALAGYFFDQHFGTRPYGLLIGFLIGAVAAGLRLYRFAQQYLKENKDDERNKKPDA